MELEYSLGFSRASGLGMGFDKKSKPNLGEKVSAFCVDLSRCSGCILDIRVAVFPSEPDSDRAGDHPEDKLSVL